MSELDAAGITGGVIGVASFARSSYRRWRGRLDHEAAKALKDLRQDVMVKLDGLETASRATAGEVASLRDRVARVEGQVQARLGPRQWPWRGLTGA